MKKIGWILGFVVMSLVISSPCYAQGWAKTYGGSSWESPGSIQQALDGGYVIGGQTSSFGAGGSDIWVLKLDSIGNVLWENTYGGLYGDCLDSLEKASDGGYIVAGITSYSNDFDAVCDIWIIKLDSAGNVAWDKTYGRSDADYQVSVQEVFAQDKSTDGWIVVGTSLTAGSEYDMWVLRLDSDGDVIWQKFYAGQSGSEQPYAIHQTYNPEGNPDGFIVGGSTSSFGEGNYDMWVVKLDNDGNVVWEKTYGGDGGDYIHSMQKTFDELGNPDGYIAAGASWSFGGNDMWVVRLDTDGDIIWQTKYGRSRVSEANSVQQTFDGLGNPNGYVVAGGTRSYSGDESRVAWVLKLDLYGNVIWEKTYDGSDTDTFESIKQTTDGGYVVTGSTESFMPGSGNIWVLKLDANGEIPYCTAMIDEAFANVSYTSAVVGLSYVDVQTSTAAIGNLGVTGEDSWAQTSMVCSPSVAPVADFGADTTSGPAPLTVQFTDHSMGCISNWSWNFGDEGISTEQDPSYIYTEAGDYTVSLTVNGPGGSDTETKTDYIHVTEPGGVPIIEKLRRKRREPGQKFNIVGSNFGWGDPGDYVRIGPKAFPYNHNRIIEWTPTNIKVKIPKKKYVKNECAWFQGLDERKVKVWVNIGGVDSNKKRLTLIKNPADCQ
jgi:PKD repeat protein